MRVAVTGAAGFIGLHVCRTMSDAGHEVCAVVREPVPALAGLRNLTQAPVGNLETFAQWSRVLEGAQAVVHLAAYAHGKGGSESLEALNVAAAVAAAKASAARFVFVSSAKVHGETSAGRPFDERSAIRPEERYAASKARAESLLRQVPGLRLTVLRPPLVYGAGVKANFLALLRAVARGVPLPLASVANRRSLLYAGNLADALVRCVQAPQAVGRTYLVSDGPAVSTPELCRAIGAALGRPARLFRFPPSWLPIKPLTLSLEVDDGAIRRELGWQPPFSMEQGLAATASWYRGR